MKSKTFSDPELLNMSYWNTRVVRKYDGESETTTYEIHEVHYDDNHQILAWTESAVGPFGETLAELEEDIEHFIEALKKPILQLTKDSTGEKLVEVGESEK